MKPTPPGWPRISTALYYDDARAAIDWLCEAFGFEVKLLVEGEGGRVEHSELVFGGGLVMVGEARADKRERTQENQPNPVTCIKAFLSRAHRRAIRSGWIAPPRACR